MSKFDIKQYFIDYLTYDLKSILNVISTHQLLKHIYF